MLCSFHCKAGSLSAGIRSHTFACDERTSERANEVAVIVLHYPMTRCDMHSGCQSRGSAWATPVICPEYGAP